MAFRWVRQIKADGAGAERDMRRARARVGQQDQVDIVILEIVDDGMALSGQARGGAT